ncbi:Wax synthase [Sesbania bispinosa]|nr:Wax synthase [Sesbania bispinosa]
MEGEIRNYINIWLQVIISLCYCYGIGKVVPRGFPTLLAIVPIMCLFLTLPLSLHSLHLGGTFAFFISWLANFKLLLFAFGKGPLSNPSLSLKQFVVFASFPVKIQNPKSPDETTSTSTSSFEKKKNLLKYTIKGLVFVGVLRAYSYNDYMHPVVLYCLYCIYIYVMLEFMLAMVAVLVRTLPGIDLEPQFNEPYLSSSLQDFWGRRWNLMASKILRPTVYQPTKQFALRLFGPKWASLLALFVTFLISGLVHELIFYYLGRVKPTWEITWFFLLHGFCLLHEVSCKNKLTAKFRLSRVVFGPLIIGFVMVTAYWLFFPQLLRFVAVQRALQKYAAVGAFAKNATRTLKLWFNYG